MAHTTAINWKANPVNFVYSQLQNITTKCLRRYWSVTGRLGADKSHCCVAAELLVHSMGGEAWITEAVQVALTGTGTVGVDKLHDIELHGIGL